MESRRKSSGKVVGFNIVQEECIWMKSGIVSFKRCDNAYDCNGCQFDKAMNAAVQSGKHKQGERLRSFREKAKEDSYMERNCRHMLSGRVAVRKCGNDFRCDVCEFDQLMEDIDAVYPVGNVPIVEVGGYRYCDSYYYHEGHAWARVEYGGRVRVGLDDFAMKLLGRPDRLELPKPGDRIGRSEPSLALGRRNHWADVLAPVGGTVLAVNVDVAKQPERMHADPYRDGWAFLVEPDGLKKSLQTLYFGNTGQDWLVEDVARLQQLVLGEFGSMAATGAVPVDDVFGQVPEVGWDTLVKTFLRTGRS